MSLAEPSSTTAGTPPAASSGRRLHTGAELAGAGRVHFRVWAPAATTLEVVVNGRPAGLTPEADGYFAGTAEARPGDRYGFRLDSADHLYPDPASRFQPDGPHGLSEIIDPGVFHWTDEAWKGISVSGQIMYELHAGTFTRQGTASSS
jgi:maltooligosyltrehalose trehalohydrolase